MLKQCLENDVDLILIDDHYSKEYKQALYLAQSKNDYQLLIEIFEQCQKLLDKKLFFLKETIDYMKKYNIVTD